MSDIQAFDPSALKKRIADTIQSNFGMLIPEPEFNKMVEVAVKEFFEIKKDMPVIDILVPNPHRRGQWDSDRVAKKVLATPISPFQAIVFEYMRERSLEALGEYFDKVKKKAVDDIIAEMSTEGDDFDKVMSANLKAVSFGLALGQRAAVMLAATEHTRATMYQAMMRANLPDAAAALTKDANGNDIPFTFIDPRSTY